jgi:hypothetical protein
MASRCAEIRSVVAASAFWKKLLISVDWENSYDFSDHLEEDELAYVAHMCQLLVQAQGLTIENNQKVFTK